MRREWLAPGAHVNAVGSSIPDGSRELDTATTVAAAPLRRPARVGRSNEAGDYRLAADEAGLGPEHIRAELGELLNGCTAEGRRSDDELTVFKSLGLAVEDLAAAQLVRGAGARERGIGVEVDF